MTIGVKFQNQGGDRFARKVVHEVTHLLLSKFFNTGILFFVAQRHMIRLSFRWWIRIYQIQKVSVSERGWNLKFPQSDANPLSFWRSQYFKDFYPKTWSKSNKKVIFGISSVRAIRICSFQPKTEVVLHFWIAGTLHLFYYGACEWQLPEEIQPLLPLTERDKKRSYIFLCTDRHSHGKRKRHEHGYTVAELQTFFSCRYFDLTLRRGSLAKVVS